MAIKQERDGHGDGYFKMMRMSFTSLRVEYFANRAVPETQDQCPVSTDVRSDNHVKLNSFTFGIIMCPHWIK